MRDAQKRQTIKSMNDGDAEADTSWLILMAKSDENEDVRRDALAALAKIPDRSVVAEVRMIIADADEDEFVKREGLFVLEANGDDAALCDVLEDDYGDEMIRVEATFALARMRTPTAYACLQRASASAAKAVSRAAGEALARIEQSADMRD